ncbi:MAG: LPS export ABC transporter permease LptG [Rhodobacteraceae bacterium]|nr:LPS export ABC transporter permease LptG [Paracoccaceae bacterium]
MITTLNRYIAWRVFLGILCAFAVITSIIMLVDFVETSRNFGSDVDVSMMTMLIITCLNTPQLIEQTIPFVVLFGVMGALFTLNKHSELIVLRASGLSAWRFLKPALVVTGLIGVLWAIAFNPLAALSAQKHDHRVRLITNGKTIPNLQTDIWLREGNEDGYLAIHAKSADIDAHKLFGVTFFYSEYDVNGRVVFSTRYDAQSAELYKSRNWVLSQVIENEDGKAPQKYETVSKSTTIDWETLRNRSQNSKNPPFWRLRAEITNAKQAGFNAAPLIMQFHKLLALPITLIAMAIIAAGASLNLSRGGGTLRLLIAGGALGFGVYFVDNIISAFGETGSLPPILAAWSVPLIVLACGLAFLSKIEDG